MVPKLSVHTESFGFEKEWLVKLMKSIDTYPDLFVREDNQTLLGMGNRKLNALYVWARGMELISGDKKQAKLTELGRIIREYDAYLTEYGSWIVLIHNLSVHPPHNPASFYWFFNEFDRLEFSRDELKRQFIHSPMFDHISLITKDKGLTGLIAALRSTVIAEELRLFEEVEKGKFRKGYPPRNLFHPLIFAYCIVDWARRNGEKDVIQIEDINRSSGMPGKVFNLPERFVNDKLDEVDLKYGKKILDVERFSGLNRVRIKISDVHKLLTMYYHESSGKMSFDEP